jgi:diaminohydroxyphosphoribosylaminopyrimidine deaminase/5-amino-6-(5-phosphoribosylamino)uracil reductase
MSAVAPADQVDPSIDARFVALALALGRRGLGNTWPNPAVGAVVVSPDGIVLGRGWTQPGGRPHAETEALKRAGASANGATLYVTLEPCSHYGKTPPCADAIVAAGIARVVSALEDPNPKVAGEGYAKLRAAGIAVDTGIGVEEALRAHAGHIRRVRDGRPHVTLKLAISADGKVALAGRRPVRITGEPATERVHLMRAVNDAVLTGIGTALSDDPLLTCRLPGMEKRSPVRVVLDPLLRLPCTSRLVKTARETPVWVVASAAATVDREAALRDLGVDVLRVEGTGRPHLSATLKHLAGRGITRLMVETGPILAAAFVAADLVDETVLFRALQALGPDAVDALEAMPLTALTQSPHLVPHGAEPVGHDMVETFVRP